ncbi:MAG: DUF2845 domain-containing protein [Flavobacteriales bacterium]|nr:DUF2845 domain-containing protein [Flavobacteriales bacterium]
MVLKILAITLSSAILIVSNCLGQEEFYDQKFNKVDAKNIFYFKKAIGYEDAGIDTYSIGDEIVMEFLDPVTGAFLGVFADTSKINLSELHYLKNDSKMRRLLSKYSSPIAIRIYEGKVFIGMSKDEAEESWGKPNDINRTITENLVSEQWVYPNGQYLYFENGVLTAIQD